MKLWEKRLENGIWHPQQKYGRVDSPMPFWIESGNELSWGRNSKTGAWNDWVLVNGEARTTLDFVLKILIPFLLEKKAWSEMYREFLAGQVARYVRLYGWENQDSKTAQILKKARGIGTPFSRKAERNETRIPYRLHTYTSNDR
jgi:hypothetical protein